MRRTVFTTSSYDPNLPSGKKFVAVHVQNEDPLYFLVEVKSKVCELFAQITKFLNLLEPELFGLAIRSSGSYVFLDPLEKLSKYAPKPWRTQNNGMDNDGLPLFNVYFRVQFYVDSYLFISDKVAKLLYYHQMRENVLHYGMALSEERAFLLASYALQADYGTYNGQLRSLEHHHSYFEPSHYFPRWVVEQLGVTYIRRHLPTLHADHAGMSKSEAQSMYIKEASDPALAPHNFHLYPLAVKRGTAAGAGTLVAGGSLSNNDTVGVWLAITIGGIAIYGEEVTGSSSLTSNGNNTMTNSPSRGLLSSGLKRRISFFPWSDIGKLSFEKKKFEIRSTGPQGRKFVYHSASEEMARHLLWFSRASHQFHLMVQQKMKEMLKREAEISRRKYRESCISSSSSASSGVVTSASTGSASSGNQTSSNNTSKSASPFSSSNSNGSLNTSGCIAHKKSVDFVDSCAPSKSSCNDHLQRISVTSVSSTTTSGIVSDKVVSGMGSDSDRDDDDLLMSLQHASRHAHHHHGVISRAITLSGCSSSQPVVSLESLALSEPIESQQKQQQKQRSCRRDRNGKERMQQCDGLTANKKHSVSISNIVISSKPTSACSMATSGIESSSSSSSSGNDPVSYSDVSTSASPILGTTSITVPSPSTNEIFLTGNEKANSKVLCLNVNEPSTRRPTGSPDSLLNCCNSPFHSHHDSDYLSSSYDGEGDSVFESGSICGKHHNTSGKSNVTVLSTILKPEAERLLKEAGIEMPTGGGSVAADEAAEQLMQISSVDEDEDKLDSSQLAELKEFEQAEKEKSILNALIHKLPPPPVMSESDSSSDSSDDEEDDAGRGRHCYSPLSMEKQAHSVTGTQPKKNVANSSNHIYENLKTPVTQCSTLAEWRRNLTAKSQGLPPPLPLRPCPSLNSGLSGNSGGGFSTPHRTGMRIGVSSLSRPYSGAGPRTKHSLLTGACVHTNGGHCQQMMCTSTPTANRFDLLNSSLSAGSEPNLYWQSASGGHPANGANGACPRSLATNKSDSVYDCRMIGATLQQQTGGHHQGLPSAQDTNNNIETNYTPSHNMQNCSTDKSNKTSPNSSGGSINDLYQLRQRSSDLNLPLITALFNDSSLMDQLSEQNSSLKSMSQSMSQIPQKLSSQKQNNPSGASVERTSTFRVDEAIAKSTLRQQQANDNNNNNEALYSSPLQASRPISWHLDPTSCSSSLVHNRLFASPLQTPSANRGYTGIHYRHHIQQQQLQPNGRIGAHFVDRIWAEHQLTT